MSEPETITISMSEVLRAVRAHQARLEKFCQEVAADRGVPLEAVRAAVFTDDYLAVHQAPASSRLRVL